MPPASPARVSSASRGRQDGDSCQQLESSHRRGCCDDLDRACYASNSSFDIWFRGNVGHSDPTVCRSHCHNRCASFDTDLEFSEPHCRPKCTGFIHHSWRRPARRCSRCSRRFSSVLAVDKVPKVHHSLGFCKGVTSPNVVQPRGATIDSPLYHHGKHQYMHFFRSGSN